ncbi:Uncharacterized protein SCF082_LOCUS17123, partial [Durusdinium trenchii]
MEPDPPAVDSVVAADLYPPDAPTDPSAVPPTLERELAKEQGTSRAADSRGHRTIAGAVLLGIFLGFVLLMALSTAMFHAFRNIAVTPASLLGAPHNEQLVVGAAQAVDHCGLADYPRLSVEELRRVQDIAFTVNGAFHFYRVASIHQTRGGAVRIEAEDGT